MSRGLFFLFGALIVAQASFVQAQEDKKLTVHLVTVPVKPGAPAVFMTTVLANPEGVPIREVRQRIQFPREKLTYAGARLGIAAELAGGSLTLDLLDEAGKKVEARESAARLELKIAGRETLGNGVLLELQFRLVTDQPGSIPITHSAEALSADGKAFSELLSSDAEVVVTSDVAPPPPSIFACFFYMH
jgi:hypothetical protein